MSKQVIRAVHGMVARRMVGAVNKDTVGYLGHAAAFTVDGVSCIVLCDEVLGLKKISESLNMKPGAFSLKQTSHVALLHSSAVTLADSGWEKQQPIKPDDWDEDDEL